MRQSQVSTHDEVLRYRCCIANLMYERQSVGRGQRVFVLSRWHLPCPWPVVPSPRPVRPGTPRDEVPALSMYILIIAMARQRESEVKTCWIMEVFWNIMVCCDLWVTHHLESNLTLLCFPDYFYCHFLPSHNISQFGDAVSCLVPGRVNDKKKLFIYHE